MRIGSVCTGGGGLELALLALWPDAKVAWHSEHDPNPEHADAAGRFLKWRHPEIPNHGDLREMAWETLEPVDVLAGGFPCQGQSVAGRRRGTDDDRWLFDDIALGLGRMVTPPRLLVFENVPGLLTVQRGHAMARVVHALAALGYVGSWRLVRASDVGACHRRERVVIVAAHAAGTGRRPAEPRVTGSGGPEAGQRPAQPGRRRDDAADACRQRHWADARVTHGNAECHGEECGLFSQGGTRTPADAEHVELPREHGEQQGRAAAAGGGRVDWGRYAAAVERHGRALGRPAPAPTVGRGRVGAHRLNPAFVEWMMMLPAGWVTDCPELTANHQLHVLGNGVVPPAIALAVADLLRDMP